MSISAPVNRRTAVRMSASVELSLLILSCSPSQETWGTPGGICSGVGGGRGGGGGASTGAGTAAAAGIRVPCAGGFALFCVFCANPVKLKHDRTSTNAAIPGCGRRQRIALATATVLLKNRTGAVSFGPHTLCRFAWFATPEVPTRLLHPSFDVSSRETRVFAQPQCSAHKSLQLCVFTRDGFAGVSTNSPVTQGPITPLKVTVKCCGRAKTSRYPDVLLPRRWSCEYLREKECRGLLRSLA